MSYLIFNITLNNATAATLLRRRRSVEKVLFFGLYLQGFFNATVTPKDAKALKTDDDAALLLCDADDEEEDVAWNMDAFACCCFFFGGGTTTATDPGSSSEEILRGTEEG